MALLKKVGMLVVRGADDVNCFRNSLDARSVSHYEGPGKMIVKGAAV